MSHKIERHQNHVDDESRQSDDTARKIDVGKRVNFFENIDRKSETLPYNKPVNKSTRPTVEEKKNKDKPAPISSGEHKDNNAEGGEVIKPASISFAFWAQKEQNSASDNKFSADKKQPTSAGSLGKHQTAPVAQKPEPFRRSVTPQHVVANDQVKQISVSQNALLPNKKSDLKEVSFQERLLRNDVFFEGLETVEFRSLRKSVEKDAIVPSDDEKDNETRRVHFDQLSKASSQQSSTALRAIIIDGSNVAWT